MRSRMHPAIRRTRAMESRLSVLLVACLLLTLGTPVAQALAQSSDPDSTAAEGVPATPTSNSTLPLAPEIPRRGGVAVAEILAIDLAVWSYDRFIRSGDTSGFHVGFNSWWDNFQHGFEFDDNHFNTNQWAHPYQGSLNFNTARSNGYGYWGSLPFAFLGSLTWEYFMEANPPAINDWINTSLGGAALGESFYRLSSLILDNTDTGGSRTLREVGAALVDPVRGLNRLIYGRTNDVTQNPEDWRPNHLGMRMLSGVITTEDRLEADTDSSQVYLEFDFRYGNPFRGAYKKPYQTFRFELQLNLGNSSGLVRAQSAGILFGRPFGGVNPVKSMIAGWQRYDYISSPNYEFGGQSFDVGYLARWGSSNSFVVFSAEVGWLVLGATKTDYPDFTGREYDYGMGGRVGLDATYWWHGRPLAFLRHGTIWESTFNGNSALHQITLSRARLNLPVYHFFGVGAEFLYYHRHSDYTEHPDVTSDSSEYRLFLNWNL